MCLKEECIYFQYEMGKPLINLVDNMVKLGSLYRGGDSRISAPRDSQRPRSHYPVSTVARTFFSPFLLFLFNCLYFSSFLFAFLMSCRYICMKDVHYDRKLLKLSTQAIILLPWYREKKHLPKILIFSLLTNRQMAMTLFSSQEEFRKGE